MSFIPGITVKEDENDEIDESFSEESNDEALNILNNLLKFDHKQYRYDIVKNDARFCRYLNTNPNIKSLEAHLFKLTPCTCDPNEYDTVLYRTSYSSCGSCIFKKELDCEIKREHWITTLLALNRLGLDRIAIDSTKQCKLCKLDKEIIDDCLINEDPKSIQAEREQIKNLHKWKPDPRKLKKNVYE